MFRDVEIQGCTCYMFRDVQATYSGMFKLHVSGMCKVHIQGCTGYMFSNVQATCSGMNSLKIDRASVWIFHA